MNQAMAVSCSSLATHVTPADSKPGHSSLLYDLTVGKKSIDSTTRPWKWRKERDRPSSKAIARGTQNCAAKWSRCWPTTSRPSSFIDRPAMQMAAEKLADEPPSLLGSKLGPYQIQVLLGAGGMGEVYKARDTRLNRIVAIKVLPRHLLERSDLRQRFEREARAIASLDHPHICALYDIGREGRD